MTRSWLVVGLLPFWRIIVDPDPFPLIVVLVLIPRSPASLPSHPPAAPLVVSVKVPAGMVMVDPGLALVNWTAPRKLQLFGFASQTDAAANDPPEGSSKRSTVIVVGTKGNTVGAALFFCINTILRSPFSFWGSASTAAGASVASKLIVDRSPVLEINWLGAALL